MPSFSSSACRGSGRPGRWELASERHPVEGHREQGRQPPAIPLHVPRLTLADFFPFSLLLFVAPLAKPGGGGGGAGKAHALLAVAASLSYSVFSKNAGTCYWPIRLVAIFLGARPANCSSGRTVVRPALVWRCPPAAAFMPLPRRACSIIATRPPAVHRLAGKRRRDRRLRLFPASMNG